MNIYFVRHGQTDWNRSKLIQGRIDNHINSSAIKDILLKACYFDEISPTHLYHTSLIRTKQTLDILADMHKWQHKPVILDLMIERDFGKLEGCSTLDYYQVTDFSTINGYETDSQILFRVKAGIKQLLATHCENDSIVFVTHAHVLKTLLILFNHTDDYSIKLNNCAIIDIKFELGEYQKLSVIN